MHFHRRFNVQPALCQLLVLLIQLHFYHLSFLPCQHVKVCLLSFFLLRKPLILFLNVLLSSKHSSSPKLSCPSKTSLHKDCIKCSFILCFLLPFLTLFPSVPLSLVSSPSSSSLTMRCWYLILLPHHVLLVPHLPRPWSLLSQPPPRSPKAPLLIYFILIFIAHLHVHALLFLLGCVPPFYICQPQRQSHIYEYN